MARASLSYGMHSLTVVGELSHNATRKLRLPPICINPHTELTMAPHAGFDPESIKLKARKDLLLLLEGVSKATLLLSAA